jgi:WD40 repeat protein
MKFGKIDIGRLDTLSHLRGLPSSQPEDGIRRYDAFISYSHAADERLAPAFQAGLQRFAKPWYKASGMRVFRDETNLSINPSLWGSIQQALEGSSYFILLASPRAASSKWVRRELEFWLSHRGAQTLLIAHTDGIIQWDPKVGDFDWKQTDALPPTLQKAYAEEPKYADFTWVRAAPNLSLRNPRFATEVARLVSAVRNRPLDEMIGDDVRQRRRMKAAVATFLAIITLTAVFAFWQWRVAKTRQQIALSRQLANQSLNQLDEKLDLALLLGVEATRVVKTVDAKTSLLTALQHLPALVTYLRGHDAGVRDVAISPNLRTVVSGDDRGKIVFWDLQSRQQIPPAIEQGHSVGGLTISSDGKTLASGSFDNTVLLWDMQTHQRKWEPLKGHAALVNSVAFSPTDDLLASGSSDETIILWEPEHRWQHGPPLEPDIKTILRVAFSPDGKRLAAAGLAGVRILDVQARQWISPVLANSGRAVMGIAFAPDNTTLAMANDDGTVVLYDIVNGRQIGDTLKGHKGMVYAVAFSAEGTVLLSGGADGRLLCWDTQTRSQRSPLGKASSGVSDIAVSRDKKTIVTANWDGTVAVWDLNQENPLAVVLPFPRQGSVSSIAFDSTGHLLLSGGYDGTTVLWDLSGRRPPAVLPTDHQGQVISIAWSAEGSRFALTQSKDSIVLGNPAEPTSTARQPVGHKVLSNLVFTARGKRLLFGTSDGVVLWDVESGMESAILPLPTAAPVVRVAYSPVDELAAVSDRDGAITLLDAHTLQPKVGRPMGHAKNVLSLTFSPDGQMLASASEEEGRSLVLWRVSDRRQIWQAALASGKEPTDVAFSRDGTVLASAHFDGPIMLWDVATGQDIGKLIPGHSNGAEAVAFSPDGTRLASAGRDGQIKLWQIDLTAWQARACGLVGRDLTKAEWRSYVGEECYRSTCASRIE